MGGNGSLSTLITGLVSGLLIGVGAVTMWRPVARAPSAADESRHRAEELLALDEGDLLKRRQEAERLEGVEGKALLALIACSAAKARATAEAQPGAETCSISPAPAESPGKSDAFDARGEKQRSSEGGRPIAAASGRPGHGLGDGVWTRGPVEVFKDPAQLFKGRATTVIRSTASDQRSVSVVTGEMSAAPFRGRKVKYTATVVLENVVGHAVLWLRVEDGFRKVLGSKNLFLDEEAVRRRIEGYDKYRITLTVPPNAELVTFGLLMTGGGVIRTGQVVLRPEPGQPGDPPHELDFAQGPG